MTLTPSPRFPAPSKTPLKNAQGAGNFVFLQCTKKKYAGTLRRVKIEITSPLGVFSARFRWRWVKMVHEPCDCKVWLLSSSIWYDFGRGPFSVIFRKNPLDPRNRGYFEGGRRHICTNPRPQSSKTPPIFPRTERVLAESSATLRESCSTEMKRILRFCPGPGLRF